MMDGSAASAGAFTCELSERVLDAGERAVLSGEHVDGAVWPVYDAVSSVGTRATRFRVLRAFRDGQLEGAAFMFRCRAWARALFAPRLLHVPTDLLGLPAHIWIRVGYCAEGIANPGLFRPDCGHVAVAAKMIDYLRRNALGGIVIDLASNAPLHAGSVRFPYVSDGRIELEGMRTVDDYRALHNNLKRKVGEFRSKGGRIEVVHGALDTGTVERCRAFVSATLDKSLVYSPFQDCFDGVVRATCGIDSENMVHFLAHLDGAFVGYHTFVRSAGRLRMVHGAFDRRLRTTRHAYENLILDTVRYALAGGLRTVHFGPIFNETKRRMMTHAEPASLFFSSNNPVIRTVIPRIFPYTRMQNRHLLAFAE